MANEVKPSGTPPKHWHFKGYYVDSLGNVFKKGKYQPDLKADDPVVVEYLEEEKVRLERKKEGPKPKSTEQKSESEPSGVSTTEGIELGKDTLQLIQTMQAMNDKRMEAQQNQFLNSLKEVVTLLKEEKPGSNVTPDDLAKAIAKAEQYRKGGHYYDDIKDIDPEDYSERGATFTSYGNSYFIVDDTKANGRAVRTPYGRVFKFLFQGNRITRVGRDQSYSSFCAFNTHSQKEIDWLREHSLYGIDFYEDTNLALSANAVKAHMTSVIIRQLNMLDQPEIIKQAKANGIPVGGDLRIIRAELALKLAEEKWQREKDKQHTTALGSYEKLLVD